MAVQDKTLTADDLWELAQKAEYSDKQLELREGRLLVMSPSSGRNSWVAATVARLIGNYVAEHGLGRITGADGGYTLAVDTVLAPDVGFISQGRIPEGTFSFIPAAPDLAVEVISPSETTKGIRWKTRTYLESGTQAVWNVYPEGQTVDIVTLNEEGNLLTVTLTAESELKGGEVLPGFSTPVSTFFT
jgi:Uma2 family endonuclease